MIKVQRAGFFTSIQDLGRFGYRHIGVPVSGAMDLYSATIANTLLDNDESAAVMELTMTGPTLEFNLPTFIAMSGAEISAKLNDKAIALNQVHKVVKGDVLSFGKLQYGCRSYLAVKNGFLTEVIMNSRSFYSPITPLHNISNMMEIAIEAHTEYEPKISSLSPEAFHKENKLEVYRGPEFDLLEDGHLEELFSGKFTISKENNRMAYQLKELITSHKVSMLTSATLAGTIQLTPAGKIIILMKDGQTTGGYPRILQLSNRSICVLAQKKFGDRVKFQLK